MLPPQKLLSTDGSDSPAIITCTSCLCSPLWELHVYVAGVCFALLALYSIVAILRLSRHRNLLSAPYFLSLNVAMTLIGGTRAVYFLVDAYNTRGTFHPVLYYFLYRCVSKTWLQLFHFHLNVCCNFMFSQVLFCFQCGLPVPDLGLQHPLPRPAADDPHAARAAQNPARARPGNHHHCPLHALHSNRLRGRLLLGRRRPDARLPISDRCVGPLPLRGISLRFQQTLQEREVEAEGDAEIPVVTDQT